MYVRGKEKRSSLARWILVRLKKAFLSLTLISYLRGTSHLEKLCSGLHFKMILSGSVSAWVAAEAIPTALRSQKSAEKRFHFPVKQEDRAVTEQRRNTSLILADISCLSVYIPWILEDFYSFHNSFPCTIVQCQMLCRVLALKIFSLFFMPRILTRSNAV